MTVKIDHRHRLLRRWHYTERYVHQACKVAIERPLLECAAYQQWCRGIHQVLSDILALRGGTDCSECACFRGSGLTGCVVDLAGVVDRVLGERYDAVPRCEHQNRSNAEAKCQFSCQRMVLGVP